MDGQTAAELAQWTVNFAAGVQKIKEGAEAPGSAITLSHEQCQAIADYLVLTTKDGA